MNLKKWHWAGFIFTLLLGTLLHFTYEWSGNNSFVALFSAVNESIWEHLKLIFVPMLIFGVIEFFIYGKKMPNFIPVQTLSIYIGIFTIIVGFYTYHGITGRDYLWADIALFTLAIILGYWFRYKQLQTKRFSSTLANCTGLLGLIVLLLCFIIFTFYPPTIPLFQDASIPNPLNPFFS